ncbi:MAG: M99 family carboxypeptidase catalytic domain-containing protein, partial [Campylobacterota bacterium]|nr:M99 family carboxypeptidase catalytic domain-containing protein [Campylobacterota bacterium]
MKIVLLLLFIIEFSYANIDIYKKENRDSNATLLVVGGIHGDEAGGYFAPSILSTNYKINSKNLWIIPNLNPDSILAYKRGINGDMNRKFAKELNHKDKDKQIIDEVKKIILNKKVSLILNLHDGHGFYRKNHQGTVFNPNAWGQTCVIDQCKLDTKQKFGNLNEIASSVRDSINKKLLEKHHKFNIRNTKTKFDDEAMQLSLTYFAVTNNKPSFAIETSKNLSSLSQKVFYQLLAIEEFMKIMDINFTRDFELNENTITKLLKEYGDLKINNNISFNLNNIKKHLSYIPLKSEDNLFEFTHPLGKIKRYKNSYGIFIGNKKVTTLNPQRFQSSNGCPESFSIEIDDNLKSLKKSSEFYV